MPQKRMECFRPLLEHLNMNWAAVFEWHKQFKEGRESVKDDERCERSKEVYRPELIGQRVRVRVTLLRFYGSSGRYSVGRSQYSSNWICWIRTVWIDRIVWNINVFFYYWTVLTFRLPAYAKMNYLKWNYFWHWNYTYTNLNCLIEKCFDI